jgi:hypothetical protein
MVGRPREGALGLVVGYRLHLFISISLGLESAKG